MCRWAFEPKASKLSVFFLEKIDRSTLKRILRACGSVGQSTSFAMKGSGVRISSGPLEIDIKKIK